MPDYVGDAINAREVRGVGKVIRSKVVVV